MSSNAENKMYTTIRMRKTKKRVTAATKLQALAPGPRGGLTLAGMSKMEEIKWKREQKNKAT